MGVIMMSPYNWSQKEICLVLAHMGKQFERQNTHPTTGPQISHTSSLCSAELQPRAFFRITLVMSFHSAERGNTALFVYVSHRVLLWTYVVTQKQNSQSALNKFCEAVTIIIPPLLVRSRPMGVSSRQRLSRPNSDGS